MNMPAKRKFELSKFLEVLAVKSSLSTGTIARRLKCHISTALRYLRELKKAKHVIEQSISNTINLWKLTGKRILLIDVDSKIPNLALMKISAWHKARGDNVRLIKIKLKKHKDGTLKEGVKVDFSDKPDKVYISVIFKKNKQVVDDIVSQYPDIAFDIGGSGYDLHKTLPDEIENLKPDYSLYPENDYSIGFSSRGWRLFNIFWDRQNLPLIPLAIDCNQSKTQKIIKSLRGCVRNTKTCPFCIVPIKEGKFRRVAHPSEWYNPDYGKIVFLDNNIIADREWFYEITDWCAEKKLKLQFNQGLDIKRMDEKIARRLLEMPTHGMISFAWDHIEDEAIIHEKIELLKAVGFTKNKLRGKVQFYIYVDNDDDYDSGLYRARELKKLSCNAFIMYNIDNKATKRINDLRRWANRRGLYWQFDIEKYKRSVDTGNAKRLQQANAIM